MSSIERPVQSKNHDKILVGYCRNDDWSEIFRLCNSTTHAQNQLIYGTRNDPDKRYIPLQNILDFCHYLCEALES